MDMPPTQSPDEMRQWFIENLFEDEQFVPRKVGDKLTVLTIERDGSLYDALIDRNAVVTEWIFSPEREPSSQFLFETIASFLTTGDYHAHWVTAMCHDCASWEIRYAFAANPAFRYLMFCGTHYLQTEPAQEEGITVTSLLLEDKSALFTFKDDGHFEVAFYGSQARWDEFRCAGTAHEDHPVGYNGSE